MTRSMQYKGYEIYARTRQLQEGGWNTEIDIVRYEGDERHIKKFIAANTFTTEEEAVARCLEFGPSIIDGRIPEIPTSELP